MEEKKHNSLSPIEKSWILANTYMKSNEIKRLNGIPQTEDISTLSDYLKNNPDEAMGIDEDTINNNRLKKTYVIAVNVKESKIYLIVDSDYEDLAIIDNSNENSLRITDNVKAKIMEKIESSQLVENGIRLKSTLEKELIPDEEFNLKDLSEKIADGEKLEPRNDRDILRRHHIYNGQEVTEEELKKEQEEKEREEISGSFPGQYKGAIKEYCDKAGMDPGNIKQTLTVLEPKSITDKLDGERLSEMGGPIIVLRFRNKEAGMGSDKIAMLQPGTGMVEDRNKYNKEISHLMDDRATSNKTVTNLEHKDTHTIQYRDETGALIVVGIQGEQLDATISEQEEFIRALKETMDRREINIQRANGDIDLIKQADDSATSEIASLCAYYHVGAPEKVVPEIQAEINTQEGPERY